MGKIIINNSGMGPPAPWSEAVHRRLVEVLSEKTWPRGRLAPFAERRAPRSRPPSPLGSPRTPPRRRRSEHRLPPTVKQKSAARQKSAYSESRRKRWGAVDRLHGDIAHALEVQLKLDENPPTVSRCAGRRLKYTHSLLCLTVEESESGPSDDDGCPR